MRLILILLLFYTVQLDLLGQNNEIASEITIGEVIEIESTILGEKRSIFVYQPKGFWGMDEQMKNLPVIYVLDGESQFLHTVATVDFLSAAPNGNDFIPRSIIIGIPNTNRNRDLTPIKGVLAKDSSTLQITGGGKNFLKFITEELIPFVDANYATSSHRTIIGHSLGGLITFEALLRKRAFFDHYIAIDPGLGFANESYMKEIIDTLQHANLSREHMFFSAGNSRPTFLEEADLFADSSDIMKLTDIPNRKFLNLADSSQWQINWTSKYYANENHFSLPQRSTYDGFRALYHYYSFPEMLDYYHPKYKHKSDLVAKIKEHYQKISSKMGYEVIPMEGYLNSFAFGIATSGREDLAVALFEYNIELHPDSPIVYNNLGYYCRSRGNIKGALQAFKDSIQLKPDPSISDIIDQLEKEITEQKHR